MSLEKLNDFEYCNENGYYKLSSEENTFNYSDGLEEEQYILDSIERAKNKTSYSDELKHNIRDWSSQYHLTKERANIIRALEIKNKKGLKVLEIGGGGGAITRYLGEEFGIVDSIEGSHFRSKIISERCKDLDNVNVFCSNVFNIKLPQNYYDLIVMIGVLEYSNVFSGVLADPYSAAKKILKISNSALKNDGKIIIAIENKFGLKYFSGAAEDHTGVKFDSIMGYTKPNTPVTYSKKTLIELLANSDFKSQQWFYPFPDYKTPTVIISEAATVDKNLYTDNWIETPFTESGKAYYTNFDESLALREIYNAGLLDEFSNSFLILATKNGSIEEQNWLIKKINTQRKNNFCSEIKLILENNELIVKRKLLFSNDIDESVDRNYYLHKLTDEKYTKGVLLNNEINKCMVNNNTIDGLLKYSLQLKEYLIKKYSAKKYEESGELILLPNSVDAVFRNIIIDERNEWINFDAEWIHTEEITVDYVLFRAIYQYLEKYSFQLFNNKNDDVDIVTFYILKKIFPKITEDRYYNFCIKEKKFQNYVFNGTLENFEISKKKLDGVNEKVIEKIFEKTSVESDTKEKRENEEIEERINKKIKSRINSLSFKFGSKRSNRDLEINCEANYDIIIPIYNAYEHLSRCISSVVKFTKENHTIYLLDDASPDKRVVPLLKTFSDTYSNIKLITSEINIGFIKNVNRGFAQSENNVIILNSDTEVTEYWIEKLHTCLRSNDRIGIVSPLSNNATILSVPKMNEPNELPNGMNVEDFAKLIEINSLRTYPRIPTGVGFCMLISREVLNNVGFFDPIFGLGYGEENDLCLRARNSGYEVACADDTYVHHYGTASFVDVELIDEKKLNNQKTLLNRYPNYNNEILEYCRLNPLREIQERIFSAINKRDNNKPNILHVIHNFNDTGGTELHTKNIVDQLSEKFNSTVLYPNPVPKKWVDIDAEYVTESIRIIKLAKENIQSNEYFLGYAGDLQNDLVEINFAQYLSGSNIDVVHFQHLANWGTLMLPFIAKYLGKKVIISLHDYFLLCPEYNLVLPDVKKKCSKTKADAKDAQCQYCLASKRFSKNTENPVLISDYIEERNEIINQIFKIADSVIAPSKFVRELFLKSFDNQIKEKLIVISHGIKKFEKSMIKKKSKKLNVAFIGNATDRKGIIFLLEVAYFLKGRAIKFEIFGGIPPAITPMAKELKIKLNGNYNVDKLPNLLSNIDLILIPSIWDETFALTLSEVQALGIPVIATKVGGMTERIIDNETGFLVPPSDSLALAQKIIELSKNTSLIKNVEENLKLLEIKTLEDNINEYGILYDTLLKNNKPVQSQFIAETNKYSESAPKISIIILTHNQKKYTKECIESIIESTKIKFELIIIDNNSTDETREYLVKIESQKNNVKVILNNQNKGFPYGINQGILKSNSDYILLLNNDVVVTNNWLDRMIEVAESDEKIGIVGPISNSVSGVQLDKDAKYNSIEQMHKYAELVSKRNKGKIEEFPRVAFLCTLIKKELIDKIGGLDERFSPGNFEDDDFCLRAQLAGYKTVIASDVFIHHYGSVSFKKNGENEYAKRLEINKQKFIDKWGATPEEIWLQGKKHLNKELKFPINNDLFIQIFERALININDEEYDLAIANLKLALENYEHSERKGYENISLADILNIAGTISLTKNELEEAKVYFEEELKSNPNSSSACFGLGEVFNRAEMLEEAKTMYEWAVINDSNNKNAQVRLEEVNAKLNLPKHHNSVLLETAEEKV